MMWAVLQSTAGWPSSSIDLLGRFFSVIVSVLLVMALAYFATRWLAGARYARSVRANLRVLEGVPVGNQASVQLVEAGEKVVLIGVTRERVTLLAEIPREQISERAAAPAVSFEKYLKDFKKKLAGGADGGAAEEAAGKE